MNIFCLKQGEVLKPSGPSVACEQQTYFRSEDGKYVCGSQASRSAAHRPRTPLTSPGWHEYPSPCRGPYMVFARKRPVLPKVTTGKGCQVRKHQCTFLTELYGINRLARKSWLRTLWSLWAIFSRDRFLYRKLILLCLEVPVSLSTCVARMLFSCSRVVSVRGFSHSPETFSGFWGLAGEMRNVAVWQERVVRQGKPSHCCLFTKLWKGHDLSTYFSLSSERTAVHANSIW